MQVFFEIPGGLRQGFTLVLARLLTLGLSIIILLKPFFRMLILSHLHLWLYDDCPGSWISIQSDWWLCLITLIPTANWNNLTIWHFVFQFLNHLIMHPYNYTRWIPRNIGRINGDTPDKFLAQNSNCDKLCNVVNFIIVAIRKKENFRHDIVTCI